MTCPLCGSDNQKEFSTEIHIHFRFRKNLGKPGIFLAPKVLVCLNCGFSSLTIPEADLKELAISDIAA
jgi:hypothetical protein